MEDVLGEPGVEENKEGETFEQRLSSAVAVDRVRMVIDYFGGSDSVTLLTSFGVQSGVMLSLIAEACPDVRVLYINTQGPTSERDLEYGRRVLDALGLKNFGVAKSDVTREEFRKGMEAVGITPGDGGKNDSTFHALSQHVFKITPLNRERSNPKVACLLSGVRRGQTALRDNLNFLQLPSSCNGGPAKAHPILDWPDEKCLEQLEIKNVPRHPDMESLLKLIQNEEKNQESIREEEKKQDDQRATEIDATKGENKDSSQRKSVVARPTVNIRGSILRSERPSNNNGKECGIHVEGKASTSGIPVPPLPDIVVGKIKCRFCIAAKKLLKERGIEYVETPVHLFPHLVPVGTKTVPVIYLDGGLVGGYSDLCEYLGVEDTLNH